MLTAKLMVCSLSFALKHSSASHAIHFSLTTAGDEQAVIPGNCKADMGRQITEYVCKLMGIPVEDDIDECMEQLAARVASIELNDSVSLGWTIQARIADPGKVEELQSQLRSKYREHAPEDEIDETVFFTDTRVTCNYQILTPIKFTPFKNQAVANFRYLKSPSDSLFSHQYSSEWHERVQNVRISASLKDTINFPSHSAKKEAHSRAKLDSLNEFSLMYQWLKECIDQIELTEGTIKCDADLVITQKLDTSYCRNSSAESISYLSDTQRTIKSRQR